MFVKRVQKGQTLFRDKSRINYFISSSLLPLLFIAEFSIVSIVTLSVSLLFINIKSGKRLIKKKKKNFLRQIETE